MRPAGTQQRREHTGRRRLPCRGAAPATLTTHLLVPAAVALDALGVFYQIITSLNKDDPAFLFNSAGVISFPCLSHGPVLPAPCGPRVARADGPACLPTSEARPRTFHCSDDTANGCRSVRPLRIQPRKRLLSRGCARLS